ncbi:uncharacterized protein LOC132750623 [Ruditapes philippinarum]|uniref:uncharacterized protein LOC132750623 n=1 Tax=Ruditapes philippinarum TaxID=129788 RepID=UPI00295B6AFD|nr:uncharacterized protein LOC132750623 [Ruditapes philippinarum]XP_060596615.1 uncharacterized protein LOC132750623 [Ruditapes philippinarum]
MEVSGQRKTKLTHSVSHGSAEDFVLFCIPCDRDGERVPAKGFCTTCNEHLCKTCYKHHRKPAPTRNHVLLDEDSMSTTPTAPISQDDFDSCDDHQDEKQKYYCRDHDIVVCSVCVTLDHRTCKVEYIPKLSKHILDSEELNELMVEMKSLEEVCKLGIKRAKDEIKAISENHDKVIKAIHQFRKEINTRLDDMEQIAVKNAESIFDKKQMHLKSLSTEIEDMKEETVQKQVCLDNLIQRNCLDKLYVEMKVAKKRLIQMKMKTKQQSRINNNETVSFVKHQAIIDMLEKYKQLGEILSVKSSNRENDAMMKDTSTPTEDTSLNLEVVEDIDMKSASDSNKCDMTGIEVIQPNKMVVCDYNNSKVKWYDTVQKIIVSELKLNNSPNDVAAITDARFVVTVPNDECVHFMSLENHRIVSDRKVNINETCYGIAYSNDKLVVSCNYHPGKVLVLDLQGKILQSFSGDNSLFCYPQYVTVNTAGTSIYVSDMGYSVKAVKQLDWQGNVINTYQPAQGGGNLRGICELNDGTFLVCLSQDSDDNLRRISDSCKPCKITLNEKLGRWYPRGIAYCMKTRRLYVSYSETSGINESCSCIKVFQLK